jgi:hypothetical protein
MNWTEKKVKDIKRNIFKNARHQDKEFIENVIEILDRHFEEIKNEVKAQRKTFPEKAASQNNL